MKKNMTKGIIIGLFASLTLAGCGGGGGGSTPVLTGAAVTSATSGTVAKVTASDVTVNGVSYASSGAAVTFNGDPASTADLKVGMKVTITGSHDGEKGKASKIERDSELEGAVTAVDLTAGSFIVMGQTVVVTAQTHFDGISGLSALNVGAEVEVDGATNSQGTIAASRVEVKHAAVNGKFITGVISSLDTAAKTFVIRNLTITYAAASLPALALADGQTVTVRGTLKNGVFVASRIVASGTPIPTPTPTPTPLDGAALYSANCASCHGALASSSMKGKSAAKIQAAIAADKGGMGSLTLTTAEIQAIATALAGTTPTPTPTPTDGASLYAANCASCHGALASSAKKGKTAAQIQSAISANKGGMGSISLTTAEIQAIATALAGTTPTPTPTPTQPALNTLTPSCATACHGLPPTTITGMGGAIALNMPHTTNKKCGTCHVIGGWVSGTTTFDMTGVTTHKNGSLDIASGLPTASCGACHSLPPSGSSHPSATKKSYVANCGICHMVGSGNPISMSGVSTHDNGSATFNP